MPSNNSATPATTVTIVGHVCIDENTASGLVTRVAGSSAMYIHNLFADRGDLAVSVLAPRGDDFAEFGAGVPFLSPADREKTLVYRNSFVDGVRHQACVASEHAAPVPLDDASRAELRRTDILLLAPLLANFGSDYVGEVMRELPATAVSVLLVQGYFRRIGADDRVEVREFSDVAEILPQFDVAVFSNEDTSDALGDAKTWSTRFPGTSIVVTQNSDGATLFRDGDRVTVPAVPLDSVDPLSTIGAGDVFSAALADAFYASRDIVAAIAAANATAAAFLSQGQASYAETA